MAGVTVTRPECFRIPHGVEFQRWQGEDEWVIYHSGTGETMRLSEAAIAVLELLGESDGLDESALETALSAMMDAPLPTHEIHAALHELLRVLLSHECIEQAPCD